MTRKGHKQQNKHTKEAIKIAENKEQTQRTNGSYNQQGMQQRQQQQHQP